MDNQSTSIDYSSVNSIADSISKSSQNMSGVFNSFRNCMKQVLTNGSFQGVASDALDEKFNELSRKLDSFSEKVEEFATAIRAASSATEDTESKLAQQASNLAG